MHRRVVKAMKAAGHLALPLFQRQIDSCVCVCVCMRVCVCVYNDSGNIHTLPYKQKYTLHR